VEQQEVLRVALARVATPKLGRLEGFVFFFFFIKIMLIEGFVLFPHKKRIGFI
jgi:hypothetical protein